MGRPTKLDDITAERIAEAISAGQTWKLAAQYAGISERTLHDWRERGEEGDEPYASFLQRLKRAEGVAALESIREIRTGALQWQARAWFLERRFPEEWAKREPTFIVTNSNGPDLTADEVDAVARAMRSGAK